MSEFKTVALEELKLEIEEIGYQVVYRNSEVSGLQCYIPFEIKEHKKFIAFAIQIDTEGVILFRDTNDQTPKVKRIDDQKELLDFLKKFRNDKI